MITQEAVDKVCNGVNYASIMRAASRGLKGVSDEQMTALLSTLLSTDVKDADILAALAKMPESVCTIITMSAATTLRSELEVRLRKKGKENGKDQ